jgi:hypothetical protein
MCSTSTNSHATHPLLPRRRNIGGPEKVDCGAGSIGDAEFSLVMAHEEQLFPHTSRKSQAALLLSLAYIPIPSVSTRDLLTDIVILQILLHPSYPL